MFKSIFSKYFTVLSLNIVVSFVAMGGMQMVFSTRYWVDEKKELLGKNAESIAELTAQRAVQVVPGSSYQIVEPTLAPFLQTLGTAIDSNVLIADNKGRIIICSEENKHSLVDKVIENPDVETLDGKDYFAVGTMGGLFTSRQYISGRPIERNENGAMIVLGYVFLSMPADSMSSYLADNFQIFFLSALGVLALTFIALYAMTYRLVNPLRQMAAATRKFGAGDFSSRIPVKGKDEVAELAMALNNMAVSLSSVEGMRRSFVANVSHELKTPMTTIAGFIDGILDGTIPDEKRSYYLKIVSDEVKRLSRLVKSMLDLSRIDNGELRLNPVHFDLTEVACSVLLSFEQRIESKNIAIVGLEDCPRMEVTGDYDLLGQVLYNLVDNAIKFTNEGGTISIRLEKKNDRVNCTVRNTGIGIPAQEMPHIFERFYKSDRSRSLDKNGVGLGLYIVKSVINLHHGEIVVRSVEGQYCEFAFWLPAADDPRS